MLAAVLRRRAATLLDAAALIHGSECVIPRAFAHTRSYSTPGAIDLGVSDEELRSATFHTK